MNELQKKFLKILCLYPHELQISPPGKGIKITELLKYSLKILRLYGSKTKGKTSKGKTSKGKKINAKKPKGKKTKGKTSKGKKDKWQKRQKAKKTKG